MAAAAVEVRKGSETTGKTWGGTPARNERNWGTAASVPVKLPPEPRAGSLRAAV